MVLSNPYHLPFSYRAVCAGEMGEIAEYELS